MTTSVLVVDEQEMVREGLGLLLSVQAEIEVLGTVATGLEAIEFVAESAPDVVLMDLELPVLGGLEATRRIVSAAPGTRVIVLTASARDEDVYDALRAGASGYVLKDAAHEELAAAVRVVASGDAYLAPSVTRRLIDDIARQRSTSVLGRTLDRLTERENEILKLVAEGLSNCEIANSLVVAEQTVKSHISSIFAKLGVRDRVQAVIFSYEHELVAIES